MLTILDYDCYIRSPSNTLWIMFHGWTDRNDFYRICQIHNYVNTCYLKAPRWWCGGAGWLPHLGSWDERLKDAVNYTVLEVLQGLPGCERLILAGNSDGATFTHLYCGHMWDFLEQHATQVRIHAVVHYAGLWKGIVGPAKGFFFIGENEPHKRIRQATQQAASEYGEQVRFLSGGHRWNPDENELIINTVENHESNSSTKRHCQS